MFINLYSFIINRCTKCLCFFVLFNSEPNQNKKRKVVKVNNNEKLVEAFDDFTKNERKALEKSPSKRKANVDHDDDPT